MAFGIKREELKAWKKAVSEGEIAFLTHYWLDERFPGCKTVTKAGCSDIEKLTHWGKQYGLKRSGLICEMTTRILIYLASTNEIY